MLAANWALVVLRGIFAVIFGVVAVVWPQITLVALLLVWGAYVLVDGFTVGLHGITGEKGSDRWLLIAIGACGILAGLATFIWPGVTAVVLLVIIAIWALVTGALYIYAAWRLRKEITQEWLLALSGAFYLLLGIFLIVQPKRGAVALAIAVGILALAWGIALIVLGLQFRKVERSSPTAV